MKKLYYAIGKYIANHLWLYYLLNYTWGLLLTIAGWATLEYLKLFKKVWKYNPENNICYKRIYILKKHKYYSFSIGTLIVLGSCNLDAINKISVIPSNMHIIQHEIGHSVQNAIFGPFMPFVVSIPSAIRYWYRWTFPKRIRTLYDDIWFEKSATNIGSLWQLDKRMEGC